MKGRVGGKRMSTRNLEKKVVMKGPWDCEPGVKKREIDCCGQDCMFYTKIRDVGTAAWTRRVNKKRLFPLAAPVWTQCTLVKMTVHIQSEYFQHARCVSAK